MIDEVSELFSIGKISDLALSYSRLSDFDRNGPKALNKETQEPTGEGVKIGSLVDDLLLNKHNFKKLYYIYDGSKPTATLGKLCDIITKNYKKIPSYTTILKITKKNNFWSKWKDEKIKETIDVPDFWNYLKAYYASQNKIVTSTEEYDLALSIVNVLLEHEHSKHIFINGLEHYNQFKFNIEYKGFILRGIIDKLLIDHNTKTVRIIDLKTGKGPADEFITSFIKWRYYLQSAVYTKAFKHICEILGLKDYKLMPFQFLYISRYEKIPLLFTIGKKWQKASFQGFTTKSGYQYRGLDELLDEVRWHIEHNIYDVNRFIYESKGTVSIDDSFIIVKK